MYVTVEGSKNYVDWHSTDCAGTTSYMILIINISCCLTMLLGWRWEKFEIALCWSVIHSSKICPK